MTDRGRANITVVDWPPGGPHPFGPSEARFFVRRTRDGACSCLADEMPPDYRTLEAIFPPGQTDLWILERFLLRIGRRTLRAPASPVETPSGFVVLGLHGGVRVDAHDRGRVVGFRTLEAAEEALDAPELAKEPALLIALIRSTLYWH